MDRREAIRRVTALLGGVAFVGGTSLVSACEKAHNSASSGSAVGSFSADDVAFLDEVADTILPTTKTPGAKAAKVGPFMAVMVTDCYEPKDQQIFRDGIKKLDDACRKANNTSFMSATPQQRLALLETLDKEQKAYMDARAAAQAKPKQDTTAVGDTSDKFLSDQRKQNAPNPEVTSASAITADAPTHYFRMMKELTMLGYFTSEIGMTQAMRYAESPGRYDPCVPYKPGDKAWAAHA